VAGAYAAHLRRWQPDQDVDAHAELLAFLDAGDADEEPVISHMPRSPSARRNHDHPCNKGQNRSSLVAAFRVSERGLLSVCVPVICQQPHRTPPRSTPFLYR
jgi:hypothetical protein